MECPFCAIVAGAEPADIVLETERTLAFFPTDGTTKGHTLVIPKEHVPNFLEMQPDQYLAVGSTILAVSHALRNVVQPDGMNLISSAGEVATQTVMHVHFHVVPRWVNDGFGSPWPDKNLATEAEKAKVGRDLRTFFKSQDKGGGPSKR